MCDTLMNKSRMETELLVEDVGSSTAQLRTIDYDYWEKTKTITPVNSAAGILQNENASRAKRFGYSYLSTIRIAWKLRLVFC